MAKINHIELKRLFGKRLKQIRLDRNLTQEQLATKTTVSVDLISNIERGVNAPSFRTLAKLSSTLNIDVSNLFLFTQFQ